MLERLTLRNFQCHEKLDIDLRSPVVVLVGRSDIGKSAILRALRWLGTNRPGGKSFIRHGASFAKVTLEVDGQRVVRAKGKKNRYYLDDRVFAAFGNEVPEDIGKLLNVGAVNFAGQLDAPFWFLKSPGEVAKELNSVVNLTLIDEVQAKIASVLRQAKAQEEVCQQRLREAQQRQHDLAWVEEAHERLLQLSTLASKIDETHAKIARLRKLLEDVQRVTEFRDRASGAIVALAKVVRRGERVCALQVKVKRLRTLLRSCQETEEDSCRVQARIAATEDELRAHLKGKCPVCGSPFRWPSAVETCTSPRDPPLPAR